MSKILKDKSDIVAWLKQHKIKNYRLVPDGKLNFIVNIEGGVTLHNKKLTHIPIQFGEITGNFYCGSNHLTSLQGGPTSVGESFHCDSNRLTSLLGGPTSVGRGFYCFNNQLTSLIGGPILVGGDFNCNNNEGLGEYQKINDFEIIRAKITSDNEKKLISKNIDVALNARMYKL